MVEIKSTELGSCLWVTNEKQEAYNSKSLSLGDKPPSVKRKVP